MMILHQKYLHSVHCSASTGEVFDVNARAYIMVGASTSDAQVAGLAIAKS